MDSSDREIELLALEHQGAMRIDTPTNLMTAAIFQPGDEVLFVKGEAIDAYRTIHRLIPNSTNHARFLKLDTRDIRLFAVMVGFREG